MAPSPLDAKRSAALGRLIARINMKIAAELSARSDLDQRLSPAQKALIINVEVSGSRVTTLAARLGISKQAASKLVQDVEAKGLLSRAPDPEDGRSSVILFTDAGLAIVEDTIHYFDQLEDRIAAEMGAADLKDLKTRLAVLAGLLDPDGF